MKRIAGLALVLVLVMSLGLGALAEGSTISVTGKAIVSLVSDTATVQLGAMTRGATAALAQAENDGIMANVQAALKALGIEDKDIVTSSYFVNPEVPYVEPYSIRQAETTYTVTNMLYVIIRDLSILSKAIDASTMAGANQIYSLTFDSTKAPEVYHQALAGAVEDGRKKAETLAAAAGKTLGDLQSITAVDTYGEPYGIQSYMSWGDEAKANMILTGDVNVSASLTMVYSFK